MSNAIFNENNYIQVHNYEGKKRKNYRTTCSFELPLGIVEIEYLTPLDKQVHACRALSVQIKNLNCDSVNY